MPFDRLLIVLSWFAIIGVSIVVAALLRARRLSSSSQSHKPEEKHPCDVMHDIVPIGAQPIAGSRPPHTCLLTRCRRCKCHWSVGLLGNWDISDFLKEESDISILERMARR